MIRTLSNRLVNSIAKNEYDEEQMEKMEYTLNIIIFESLKLLGSIIVFSISGYFIECCIATATTLVLKPFIGGYHEKTQIKCFIATLLLTAGEIVLSKQCPLSFSGSLILIVICLLSIYNEAPVINPLMPLTRPELIQRNRKIALINTSVVGSIAIIFYNINTYSSLMVWTVTILTLLMFNKKNF